MPTRLDLHYQALIAQEFSALGNHRTRAWPWVNRLFKHGEASALQRLQWFWRLTSAAVVCGAVAWVDIPHQMAAQPHLETQIALCALMGITLGLFFPIHFLPDPTLRWLKSCAAQPADVQQVKELTTHIERTPRLKETVIGLLKAEGTEQITQAQVTQWLRSAQRISEWTRLDAQRQAELDSLDEIGVVSQARAQLRAQALEADLPAAVVTSATPPRF